MTTYYYDPWKLGMLTESITVAITPIEKLDTSKEYVVTTNGLLAEQYDFTEEDTEVNWRAFHDKHHSYTRTEEVQLTDSIFMWAEGDEANKAWKWCKYGGHKSSARGIDDGEFIQGIQHEGKVMVVPSVSTGTRWYFSNGDVEEIENNEWSVNDDDRPLANPQKTTNNHEVEQVDLFATGNHEWISTKRQKDEHMNDGTKNKVWDFEDEDETSELVREVRHCLYEGYYKNGLGDEFSGGLEYVVKNTKEIQGLDLASQIELVRRGYEELADDMGQFAHALSGIASRGTTAFRGPAIDD